MKVYAQVIAAVLAAKAHRAVKYLSPTHIVRATRRGARKRCPSLRDNVEVLVTVGRPNYLEARFIKACKKAGEPFPVRRIQLQHFPKRHRK